MEWHGLSLSGQYEFSHMCYTEKQGGWAEDVAAVWKVSGWLLQLPKPVSSLALFEGTPSALDLVE